VHTAQSGRGLYGPSSWAYAQIVCNLSACRCPFLRHEKCRRRLPNGRTPRGDAEIVGFRNYGISFYTERNYLGFTRGWGLSDLWSAFLMGAGKTLLLFTTTLLPPMPR
jgi:hypothetical protein